MSLLQDVEIQAVADALKIHTFMLSRWRKEARDRVLRGRVSVTKVVKILAANLRPRRQSE